MAGRRLRCRGAIAGWVLVVGFGFVCMVGAILPDAASAGQVATETLTADFPERDRLPQSDTPESAWYTPGRFGAWGPRPSAYPAVTPPEGMDPLAWTRLRIAAVARRYEGLPYRRHHIPGWNPPGVGPGLDCSNFSAWVYNYGLGIRFSSDIARQAEGPRAPGRRLAQGEPFAVGDLLFITKKDRSRVSHAVIWLGGGNIIDAHAGSVRARRYSGWYVDCFSHARRVLE